MYDVNKKAQEKYKTNKLYSFIPISIGDDTSRKAAEKASVNPFFPLLNPEIFYKPIPDEESEGLVRAQEMKGDNLYGTIQR